MFKKISEKTGFTQTEVKVLLFLLIVFAIGFSYKTLMRTNNQTDLKKFNYEKEDSLFNTTATNEEFSQMDEEIKDKTVDYKQEVLDYNKSDLGKYSAKETPAEKSINLNKAGVKEFTRLPGIGEKTAAKIIQLRNEVGRFTKLEDLLKVKGIGTSKFNKLKKYIYID